MTICRSTSPFQLLRLFCISVLLWNIVYITPITVAYTQKKLQGSCKALTQIKRKALRTEADGNASVADFHPSNANSFVSLDLVAMNQPVTKTPKFRKYFSFPKRIIGLHNSFQEIWTYHEFFISWFILKKTNKFDFL